MASGSPHRSTQSISTNLRLPAQGSSPTPIQQRRMTSPVGSLTLPDGGRRPSPRPPSPLRNGFVMDTSTGIDPNASFDGSDDEHDDDNDDDPAKWHRSPSPASSVSHLAASFVQRMNSFVGGIAPPKSPGMPTDAELEAEAERERDRSRREAEAILTREAQQRKLVEERVLAMMESAKSLPPPPSRSQTVSTPSPSSSQKESSSWWTAAKNKLTPTKDKEGLTPAQQVIQDAKAREKKGGKGKEKEKEWPANAQGKYNDPAFANLNIPVAPPTRKPVPSSPSSPTPSRPSLSNMPPNLTPSPMRTLDTISSSPSRETPPMYAQFNTQGTLDVPGTLLAIAKRFEKLEKWTVGHVRALEDRMNDVEKWLVDKETEKNTTTPPPPQEQSSNNTPYVQNELHEIREEMSELQGRVGELGREMAKMATAPSNLSSVPRSQTAAISVAPQTTSSFTVKQDHTGSSIPSTPRHPRLSSSTAIESTSPPIASNKTPSGTRLPYPQGDYTSPPDAFSPTNSPPGSINASMRSQSIPISGLPNTTTTTSTGSMSTMYSSSGSYSSISSFGGRTMSPSPMSPSRSTAPGAAAARALSPTPAAGNGLPPPAKPATQRQTSVSPTPRKRYTVALGGPIVAPDELSSNSAPGIDSKRGRGGGRSKATFDREGADDNDDDDEGSDFGGGEETIGKSAAARLASSGTLGGGGGGSFGKGGDYKQQTNNPESPSPMSKNNRRVRAQSAYGFSNIAGSHSASANMLSNTTTTTHTHHHAGIPSVAPLKPKLRSKSSERLHSSSGTSGTGDGMISSSLVSGTGGTKFVDPLVLRRQSKDSLMSKPIAMPKPVGKVPIGQLVAFFDGDKK